MCIRDRYSKRHRQFSTYGNSFLYVSWRNNECWWNIKENSLFLKCISWACNGRLGLVLIVTSMLFAGVSGSAVADTSAIGSILLPIMDKEGYDKIKSTALVVSAGCIG